MTIRERIPADFPVQPIDPGDKTAQDPTTCGTCGLTWDDAVPTSWTPAPSARCPFEYFHNGPDDDEAQRTMPETGEYQLRVMLPCWIRVEYERGLGQHATVTGLDFSDEPELISQENDSGSFRYVQEDDDRHDETVSDDHAQQVLDAVEAWLLTKIESSNGAVYLDD